MPKIPKRLEDIRDPLILQLFEAEVDAKDIGTIFHMSTSAIYGIIKELKEK
jgi:hypothetical protein